MVLTLSQLKQAMPDAGFKAPVFLDFINGAMAEFGIKSEQEVEMFLATIAHESGDLRQVTEGLNYSAAALCRTWPTRFPTLASAMPYNRNPQKIANRVYADRMGNGNEASGDGWRYRGAGLIQLTGKSNQARCAAYFKRPLDTIGDWLRSPEGASRSAAWFWHVNGCGTYANRGDFDGVCDVVNRGRKTEKYGDAIGFADRQHSLEEIQRAIGDSVWQSKS